MHDIDIDRPNIPYEILSDFKRRFPEISEKLIVELMIQFSGNIQQVNEELKKKSNLFMYGEKTNEFAKNPVPLHNKTTSVMSNIKNNFVGNSSPQYDIENINMNETAFSAPPKGGSGDFSRELPVLPDDMNGYNSNFNTITTQSPADIFLQRRTISDDSFSYRRQTADVKRERSTSDLTDMTNVLRMKKTGNNFVQPLTQRFDQNWQTPPQRFLAKGNDIGDAVQNNNQDLMLQDKNSRVSQNIQLQIDSCDRMQAKVDSLRTDVERIRMQVMQEEDDIDTSSKVQRNPTEKDVLKLNKEIEILKKEVLEADTALEEIKAAGSGGATSTSSILPSLQRIGSEEMVSVIQPPLRPHFNTKEPATPHPHMSAARFPHSSYLNQHFNPVTSSPSTEIVYNPPRIETPPPDYSTLVNPIPEISDDQWECGACTFKNHAELPECEVCGHQRSQ